MGKQERAARREANEAEASAPKTRTIRVTGIWAEESQGWAGIVADVPLSVLEPYIDRRLQPDVLPITLGKATEVLEHVAMKGIQKS